MALSRKSVEALMDLVEIKLSCIEIFDREDAREVKALERCRDELRTICSESGSSNVIKMPAKRAGARVQAQAV